MSKLVVTLTTLSSLALATHTASADDTASADYRDPQTAFGLSLGGTLLSVGVIGLGVAMDNSDVATVGAIGTMFLPSAGEWYAGKPITAGLGIRAVSVLSFAAGVSMSLKCLFAEDNCQSDDAVAVPLMLAGMGGYVGGTIYDIATAGRTADEYNARSFQLHVMPTVMKSANTTPAVGVGIGGRF